MWSCLKIISKQKIIGCATPVCSNISGNTAHSPKHINLSRGRRRSEGKWKKMEGNVFWPPTPQILATKQSNFLSAHSMWLLLHGHFSSHNLQGSLLCFATVLQKNKPILWLQVWFLKHKTLPEPGHLKTKVLSVPVTGHLHCIIFSSQQPNVSCMHSWENLSEYVLACNDLAFQKFNWIK